MPPRNPASRYVVEIRDSAGVNAGVKMHRLAGVKVHHG
jgi:hypothetical protein